MVGDQAVVVHGLTVCVDYAEFLAVSLDRWVATLETLTVVTSYTDTDTVALVANRPSVTLHQTDLFYQDGAVFNKGRAMEAARELMPWSDWILFFDADIVPPLDWLTRSAPVLQPGVLYGVHRFAAVGGETDDHRQPSLPHDTPGVGYFQLFHSSDPAVRDAKPLIDTHWRHAGNYDNRLLDRWRKHGRAVRPLPFRVAHIGERDNWCGRGNRAGFEALQAERKRRGGRWDHEHI